MIGHRQVADADADLIVEPDVKRINPRKNTAVPTSEIEVQHGHNLGSGASRFDIVGIQQKHEVTIYLLDERVFVFGVGNPGSHHAHGHLGHFIGMGVIHEGTGAAGDKFIHKSLPRLDCGLRQA